MFKTIFTILCKFLQKNIVVNRIKCYYTIAVCTTLCHSLAAYFIVHCSKGHGPSKSPSHSVGAGVAPIYTVEN